jgi:predicted dehydrogenase
MNPFDEISPILVIGSGSAGRRHALALRELAPNSKITLIKRSSGLQPLEELHKSNIQISSELDESLKENPMAVVIASPATKHLEDAEHVFSHCKNVLIEKPLAHSAAADQLVNLGVLHSASVMVGYHLRFSETQIRLLELKTSLDLGSVVSAQFGYGQHLSLWRPSINPENSVTARSDLGGGVLLELSHEIDAVDFLIGKIVSVESSELGFHGAPTDGLVETIADFRLIVESGVEVIIHLDMTDLNPWRIWRIHFENGMLEADLLKGQIFATLGNSPRKLIHQSNLAERKTAALDQGYAFLSNVQSQNIDVRSLRQSAFVSEVIEVVRQTFLLGQPIPIVARNS